MQNYERTIRKNRTARHLYMNINSYFTKKVSNHNTFNLHKPFGITFEKIQEKKLYKDILK